METIGEGAYGLVHFEGNSAIKEFKDKTGYEFYVELFYLSIFKGVEGICQIVDADPIERTITMKKYDGSLTMLSKILTLPERVKIADDIVKQILPVINLLHSRAINHADITPRNIFYIKNEDGYEFVLGDFSRASVTNEYKTYGSDQFGDTFLYTDPDRYSNNRESDRWYFGVTLWEFLIGSSCSIRPYEKLKYQVDNSFLDFRFNYPRIPITNYLNLHLRDLLQGCGDQRRVVEITNSFFDSRGRNRTYHVRNMEKTGLDARICRNIFETAISNNYYDSKKYGIPEIKIAGIKLIKALSEK